MLLNNNHQTDIHKLPESVPSLYKGNSSNTIITTAGSASFPITPHASRTTSIDNKLYNRGEAGGYDSDSSEEGRHPTLPQQIMNWRITNPDSIADTNDDSEDKETISNNIEQKGPALPPHQAQPPALGIHHNYPENVPSTPVPYCKPKVFEGLPQQDDMKHKQQSTSGSAYEEVLDSFAAPPRTSTQIATDKAATSTSKYAKISYHLTNDPSAIKLYRDMAEKTRDSTLQLMFAKYLLEAANALYPIGSSHNSTTVVGSMWGIGTTSKKATKPEPFLVVPSVSEGGSCNNSIGSKQNASPGSVNPSEAASSPQRTSLADRSSAITANIMMKQSEYTSLIQQQNKSSNVQCDALDHARAKRRKALEDEGVKWIKRLAKLDVGEACYMLANWMDREMYGFKQNKTRSIELHHKAAKANIPESLFAVAEYLEVERIADPATIVSYYKKSANYGYVKAIYKLSLLTLRGHLNIRQSLTQGLKLMYEACKLSTEEFSKPLYVFGLLLTNDEQGDIDVPSALVEEYGGQSAAILYYERAASFNYAKAQSKLGYIYEQGLYGESMNFARAFFYYEAAALSGNPKAMMGLCRLNNRGSHGLDDRDEAFRLENDVSGWLVATPINEDVSFQWCEKAASAGLVEAIAMLGWFYEIGFGSPRDFSRAKEYYQQAAAQGHCKAKSRLMETNRSITKQQHEAILSPAQPNSVHKKQKKVGGGEKNKCFCM